MFIGCRTFFLKSQNDYGFMVFIQKKENKQRKNILIVDNNCEIEQLIREPLLKELENSSVSPILVRAKDGAEAAIKSENQKFDVVVIDTDVPRLMDGGFVYGIHTYRNTQDAEVMLVSHKEFEELPESLQRRSTLFKKPINPHELVSALTNILNSQNPSPLSSAKFAVDVRVINAVIKAAGKVLSQYGLQCKMDKAMPQSPTDVLPGEVSSVIDIKSLSFQGLLSISFDKQSYLELVSAMLMEEQTDITPDNQDAVGEINNIIFGNAKAEITNYGVEMTVPRILMKATQALDVPQGSAGMQIPFATEKGRFYLRLVAFPGS